jgi:hypothetical protein
MLRSETLCRTVHLDSANSEWYGSGGTIAFSPMNSGVGVAASAEREASNEATIDIDFPVQEIWHFIAFFTRTHHD